MRKGVLFVMLLAFHAALSGTAQLENPYLFGIGAAACLAITALSARLGLIDDEGVPVEYWIKTALYTPWLVWQIVVANIDVARRVWHPELPIDPRMFRLPHSLKTPYGVSTYINSITLTPGTVTVDVGEDEFLIHALTKEAADDLLTDAMHDRIKKIEGTR